MEYLHKGACILLQTRLECTLSPLVLSLNKICSNISKKYTICIFSTDSPSVVTLCIYNYCKLLTSQ